MKVLDSVKARVVITQSAQYGPKAQLQVCVPGTDLWVDVTADSFMPKGGDRRIPFVSVMGKSLLRWLTACSAISAPTTVRVDTTVAPTPVSDAANAAALLV